MIEDDEIMDVNDDWQEVGLGLGWMQASCAGSVSAYLASFVSFNVIIQL